LKAVQSRARLVVGFAALAAAALLFGPGSALAWQTVTIEGATLHIAGDNGKTTDEVTITIDYFAGDYVIGHDINMTTPPAGCHFEGPGPPYKVLRCPIKGIKRIRIETGDDRDKVDLDDLVVPGAPPVIPDVYLSPELEQVTVNAGAGNDRVAVNTWKMIPGGYTPRLAAHASAVAPGTNPAVAEIDTGPGVDTVSADGGDNTVTFGDSGKFTGTGAHAVNKVSFGPGNSQLILTDGTNQVSLGAGNSKATVSGGANQVTFGAGTSTFTATGGTNAVVFGAGNSILVGGPGADAASFGVGNNSFTGGGGNDVARMGAGRDNASGGAGKDLLVGGRGNDRLRGGAGFDILKGGAGHRDECLSGGRGLMVGCELP
jgi:Ca2+-binding RTX toxin-like protein